MQSSPSHGAERQSNMSSDVVAYEEKIGALSVVDVRGQVNLIQHIMKEVMKENEHYGVIPGTGTKPSLLKAGAEKLCLTFRLDPQYEIERQQEGVHLTITSKCTLFHIPSGQRYGSGMGSCSTRESKYAYRKASRKCPDCTKETIIKGKEEYGGGWVCFKRKGGCGAKFNDGDKSIEGQAEGRVPNEDIADQYNTVLKMANKRSLVAAVLNATAASDIFTQDIEDMPQFTATVSSATQEVTLAPKPSSSTPSAESDVAAFITLEQAMDLAQALADCDPQAQAAFLKVAKIERLDNLLAEVDGADMYAGALEWIARRKASKKK